LRNKIYLHLPISTNGHTNLTQIFQEIGQHFSYSFPLVCWHVLQLLQFRWSGVQVRLKKNNIKNSNRDKSSDLIHSNSSIILHSFEIIH
jgi:hypothetical protein